MFGWDAAAPEKARTQINPASEDQVESNLRHMAGIILNPLRIDKNLGGTPETTCQRDSVAVIETA